MPKTTKFKQVFDLAKERIAEHNLTIDELHRNTEIPIELLRIILDDSTNVINDLSRLFEFLNIRVSALPKSFRPYIITDDEQQLKITRVIEPRCSMYYDKMDGKCYSFSYKKKRLKHEPSETKVIQSEMKALINKHLNSI